MGIAIISSDATLSRRAARAAHAKEVPIVAILNVGDSAATLGAALDVAARRDDVSAVLIHTTPSLDHAAFSAVCRQASPHVPVVFSLAFHRDDDPEFSAIFSPWVQGLGALWADSLGEAVDAVALVRALDPPAELRARVCGGNSTSVSTAACAARDARFEVTASDDADFNTALSDLHHDLVVLTVDADGPKSEGVMPALLAARAEHDELPLVVVADGPADFRNALATEWASVPSTVVVPGYVELSTALDALRRWRAVRRRASTAPAGVRDPSRLRRALYTARKAETVHYLPDVQRELAAGLGLPFPRAKQAGYLDDALFAAAEFGYPVRIAAVFDSLRLPDEPVWALARHADELRAHGERLVAAAQRALGRRVQIVVAEALPASQEVAVSVSRHPRYGVVLQVSTAVGVGTLVPPVVVADVRRAMAPLPLTDALVEGVYNSASALVHALELVEDVAALQVVLDVGSAGFIARHVGLMITTNTDEEQA